MSVPSSSRANSDTENASNTRDNSVSISQLSRNFGQVLDHVSIPTVDSDILQEYRSGAFSESDGDPDEEQIIEFVGEYRLGTDLFLYARYNDGICRRVSRYISIILKHCFGRTELPNTFTRNMLESLLRSNRNFTPFMVRFDCYPSMIIFYCRCRRKEI